MSFLCAELNEVVIGEKQCLVPTKIRQVTYIGRNKNGEDEFSQGWEIVEEKKVSQGNLESFMKKNPTPAIVQSKKVNYVKSKRQEYRKNNFDYDMPS